ncbi:MAG: RusA family crossover junction endodeoxyribonuclease [Solirubrobacteraceae bacterium]
MTDPFYDGLPEAPAQGLPDVEMLPSESWPPAHAVLVCEFVVIGEPKTAGSKRAFVNPKTGRAIVTDDAGKAGKSWRADVSDAGMHFRPSAEPLDGRLAMELVFVTPYKPADYSKRDGRLRDSMRVAPHTRPDALKLARAAEDALSSIVYTDDARITEERIRKVHVAKDKGPQRCEVRVWQLPTTWGELRACALERYEPEEEQTSLLVGGDR